MNLGKPHVVDTNQVAWEEVKQPWYARPIRRKLLRRDENTGALHLLVNYPAGTYAHFPAGEVMLHTSPPDQDCTFLLMFEAQPDFVVEGGPAYTVR